MGESGPGHQITWQSPPGAEIMLSLSVFHLQTPQRTHTHTHTDIHPQPLPDPRNINLMSQLLYTHCKQTPFVLRECVG